MCIDSGIRPSRFTKKIVKGFRSAALCVLAAAGCCLAARADTLASFTAGKFGNSTGYYGQPFTVGGTGTYNNIAFSFLSLGAGSPYAIGTGFLFSAPFLGPPAALGHGSNLPFATTDSSKGLYRFDPSVTLVGGDTYYFYENAVIQGSTIEGAAYIPTLANPTYAYSNANFALFRNEPGSNDFRVLGAAVTPEPSSLLLLGTGLLTLCFGLYRRRLLNQAL